MHGSANRTAQHTASAPTEDALLRVLRSAPPVAGQAVPADALDSAASTPRSGIARGLSGYALVIAAMLALVVVTAIAGLMFGSVRIEASTSVRIALHWLSGGALFDPDWRSVYETIIVQTRIPRVLQAAIVGASLATIGMTIQAIVRNPLASPTVLGISQGSALGAVVVMRFQLVALGAFTLNIAAFVGALAALVVVFNIARTGGKMTPVRLILAGIALNLILQAVTDLLVLTSPDPRLASQVLFWRLGGFASAQWKLLPIPAIALVAGLAMMLVQARRLNLLMAGDESAVALGLNVQRFRQGMFVLAAAMVGVTVAVSGVIVFVGLIMPHIVRLLVGADHRRALPIAALSGASFVVAADLVARTIISPLELPVGLITALVGGPFFVWLLWREARREGVNR